MKRILVVDDDENVITVMRDILNRLGCQVFVARNGLEGVEILANQSNIDLVFTDIRMPEMNGNDFATYIHNSPEYQDTPVVAVTGHGDEAERNLFQSVLLKPFNVQDLARVIGSVRLRSSNRFRKEV